MTNSGSTLFAKAGYIQVQQDKDLDNIYKSTQHLSFPVLLYVFWNAGCGK